MIEMSNSLEVHQWAGLIRMNLSLLAGSASNPTLNNSSSRFTFFSFVIILPLRARCHAKNTDVKMVVLRCPRVA